jgi:Caspase domain
MLTVFARKQVWSRYIAFVSTVTPVRTMITMRKLFSVICLLAGFSAAHGETLVFHASSSGQKTLDQGEGGGNPFASSLVEILGRPEVRLGRLPEALRTLTKKKSGDYQTPDVPRAVAAKDWKLLPPAAAGKRIALVLIVSDYSRAGLASLDGAAHDARRIASALTKAGFATETALDLELAGMKRKLAGFAAKSAGYDAAAIYTTGHGLEYGGIVYLLPSDYPVRLGKAALRPAALQLSEIANAARARKVNLVFYGGCRDHPFQ